MKQTFKFNLLFGIAMATFVGCSSDSGSSAEETDTSSSSIASFKSSNSISDRADINYQDTVKLGATFKMNIEIDSISSTVPIYLGQFTKGSRIKLYASTKKIKNDRIRIRSEHGDYLDALVAIPKSKDGTDSVFANYLAPSLGSDPEGAFLDSNQFVVFKDNYYYVEISGDFNDTSAVTLKAIVDTSYYSYASTSDTISMQMSDTVRGIVSIEQAPDYIQLDVSAIEGNSVNLFASGKNIDKFEFCDGDSLLDSHEKEIDTLLIPKDSSHWNIKIYTETFANYLTGPYAFFEAVTKSRKLDQGEYFSFPDSISYPGSTHVRTRPKDNPDSAIYKYNLRQEQYIWIGNYVKGDTIFVEHSISNYSDNNAQSPLTLEILDKNQKTQATVSSTYGGGLKITDKMPEGPYYLHYLRLNSAPLDQVSDNMRYVLQLSTLVKQPGLLDSITFYDSQKDQEYNTQQKTVKDTIWLGKYEFSLKTKSKSSWKKVGTDVKWYVPCESLNYINNGYIQSSCEDEQEIRVTYLVPQRIESKQTAKLIAESLADPTQRDTLELTIFPESK
ncbi:MAG: hypothetical protein HUK20_12500 [Fibrobacter sp.]|nr:hypothetical protein [Fibrobacter sp.]